MTEAGKRPDGEDYGADLAERDRLVGANAARPAGRGARRRPLSYGEYKAWSDRVAAMLEADGLQPGDRVAICSTNSLAYCALIMGDHPRRRDRQPGEFPLHRRAKSASCARRPSRVSALPRRSSPSECSAAGPHAAAMAEIEALRRAIL
jgi:fatty-acyl-CoA synthase